MPYYESDHDYDREGRADAWGDALDERYLIDRAEHEAHDDGVRDHADWTDLDWIIDEDRETERASHARNGDEPDDEMAAALLRECPACGAPAGELCGDTASEKRPIPDMVDDVHKARVEG
jgi:hypothetical protein